VLSDIRGPLLWNDFFSSPSDVYQNHDWGSWLSINSVVSFARIRDIHKDDLAAVYQGGEGIVGFVRFASDGYSNRSDGKFNTFDLDPKKSLSLSTPVPLTLLKSYPNALDQIELVKMPFGGTVLGMTKTGFDIVCNAVSG